MLYRRSPAHPTRLLLAIVVGAGTSAALALASCGGATDPLGSGTLPDGQSGSGSSGTTTGGSTGASSGASGGAMGGSTSGSGASAGAEGSTAFPPTPPPSPPPSSGGSSGGTPDPCTLGLCVDASVVHGVVPLPADAGADVRLGLIVHPEGGEDVLLGTIVHPEGGEDVFVGTIIRPDGGPFGIIVMPPDSGR